MLDYHELATQVRKHGGFTTALDASQPIVGFAVADGVHEECVPVRSTLDIERAIYAYVVHNGTELRAGAYLGGWMHDDRLYLDCVELYEDLQTALDRAALIGEQAVYSLTDRAEVPA